MLKRPVPGTRCPESNSGLKSKKRGSTVLWKRVRLTSNDEPDKGRESAAATRAVLRACREERPGRLCGHRRVSVPGDVWLSLDRGDAVDRFVPERRDDPVRHGAWSENSTQTRARFLPAATPCTPALPSSRSPRFCWRPSCTASFTSFHIELGKDRE